VVSHELVVLLTKLHLVQIGELGHNLDGGKGGLAAACGVKGGDPHQAVHAVFALEVAIGVGTLHRDGSGLDAGLVTVLPIHELDLMLYFMGYPKVKSAVGFSTDVNTQHQSKLASGTSVWETGNKVSAKKDIENYISGYVTFENGSYIFLKSSFVLHTPNPGVYIEINGERAGACMEPFNKGKELYMVVEHDNLMHETKPNITVNDSYATEINHFVDCVANDTECICKADEAVMLMEVVDAIYKSSETGEAVVINE